MSDSNCHRPCFDWRFAIVLAVLCLPGACVLPGCAKVKASPAILEVRLAGVRTNAGGEVLVQLNLTNNSASVLLVGVRSAVYREQASWITNFGIRPLFVGVAGPGSAASDVALNPGTGLTVALSPLEVRHPFQLELLCFRTRSGIAGMVDDAKDKVAEINDGNPHETYLGGSSLVLSPVINPAAGGASAK